MAANNNNNKRKLKQESFCVKRRKSNTSPDWSSLHGDILETILKRMPFVDKLRFIDSCSSWNSIAKSHVKSCLIELKERSSPMLLMPAHPESTKKEHQNCVFDIANKVHKPLMNMPVMSHCIGSSQGWLILLQDKVNLLVYNPHLDVKIYLPSIVSLPSFDYNPINLSEHWISKAILWGDPLLGDYNYGVALIYGWNSKIAFAKNGNNRWTQFENSDNDYCDLIPCRDFICALSSTSCVEVWNINYSYPAKVMEFEPSFPKNIEELEDSNLYTMRSYIVESKGDLLLVVRCVGEYVSPYGEVVYESDLFEGENMNVCCPYMTKNFYIYKLEFDKWAWMELHNLGDQTLFVGGNQSISLSAKDYAGCEENAIYFSDDYWLRMDEDYMYGGHDMGIFNLESRSVEEIYECELNKMAPAFWILPS